MRLPLRADVPFAMNVEHRHGAAQASLKKLNRSAVTIANGIPECQAERAHNCFTSFHLLARFLPMSRVTASPRSAWELPHRMERVQFARAEPAMPREVTQRLAE